MGQTEAFFAVDGLCRCFERDHVVRPTTTPSFHRSCPTHNHMLTTDSLLYLISFSIFTSSVLKHRREGGKAKPLSPEDSHPGPFSFDETHEVDSHPTLSRHEGTDEEAGRKSKKQSKEEKKAAKDVKEAEKEDRRAIRNMKRGGSWKKDVAAEPQRPKTHSRLSLHGFEGKQMQMARSRDIGEMEPAMGAPYVRGG